VHLPLHCTGTASLFPLADVVDFVTTVGPEGLASCVRSLPQLSVSVMLSALPHSSLLVVNRLSPLSRSDGQYFSNSDVAHSSPRLPLFSPPTSPYDRANPPRHNRIDHKQRRHQQNYHHTKRDLDPRPLRTPRRQVLALASICGRPRAQAAITGSRTRMCYGTTTREAVTVISISIGPPSHGRAGLGACFAAILIRRACFPSCVNALLSDLNVGKAYSANLAPFS